MAVTNDDLESRRRMLEDERPGGEWNVSTGTVS
jgi:hypothetical protein